MERDGAKPGRTRLIGKAMHWWAEGWVTFARSAGGRAEDVVGSNAWHAATQREESVK